MKSKNMSALIALFILFAVCLACNLETGDGESSSVESGKESKRDALPRKLDSYEIKGFKFAYYLIPADLDRDELIKTAEKIHSEDGDSQLVLVDDDSELAEYIKYAKAVSGIGEIEGPMPLEWADKHIVANLQKHLNGQWVLYDSYGNEEIGRLKEE